VYLYVFEISNISGGVIESVFKCYSRWWNLAYH